jgi:hypothetical protein
MCKFILTGGGSKNERRDGKYCIDHETKGYLSRPLSFVVGDVKKLSI